VPPPSSTTPNFTNYNYSSRGLSCRFSSNNTIALGDSSGVIFYLSASYASIWNYTSGTPSIKSVAFSSNASLIGAGGGGSKTAYTFNNNSNTLISSSTFAGNANSVDFSPDSMIFAVGDDAGNLEFFDVTKNYFKFHSIGSLGAITSIDFSSDSCWLAVGSSNTNLYFYSANCMKKQAAYPFPFRCAIDQYKFNTTKC
jgi:WD40 repeat protein